jgi:hydroxyacylglutathione hydrolase
MKVLNREGPAILGQAPSAPRLDGGQLAGAIASGQRVVDLRRTAAYAEGYIPGTINIALSNSIVSRAGWLLSYDEDFYLISDADDDAGVRQALAELAMIGFDRCAGWFGRDVLDHARAAGTLATMPQLEPQELATQLDADAVTLIDVRNDDEWAEGHIPGAVHIPLGRLEERLHEVDTSQRVVVQCRTGSRSAVAASLLKARGVADVANLKGGIVGWEQAGQPLVPDESAVAGD